MCRILFCCDDGSSLRLARPQGSAASVLVEDVLQLVLRGAHDSIPNVRFTAVRALQEMAPHLDAGAVDSQVRYFGSSLSTVFPRFCLDAPGGWFLPHAGWLHLVPSMFVSGLCRMLHW